MQRLLGRCFRQELYAPLKNHPFIKAYMEEELIKGTPYEKGTIKEGFMSLTDFGKAFCNICLTT